MLNNVPVLLQIHTVTHIQLLITIYCQVVLECEACNITQSGYVTYVGILVKKVQSIQIYCQDARGVDGSGATALDVEEGGAEHGEGTDQTWAKKHKGSL